MITQNYTDLWNDPELQTRIDDGIRRNRQSGGRVQTLGMDGRPLEGVKIRVQQQSSPFHLGANIFKLGDYPDDEVNHRYEQKFCGLFNGATVPFYWRTLEPEQGRPRYQAHSVPRINRRPPPDAVVEFCQKHGLRMHGHTLAWAFQKFSIPDWLPEDPAQAVPIWERRFREIGERYGGVIKSWDVLNEAVFPHTRPPLGHPMFENYERAAFEWAERYFPADSRFDINEITDAWDLSHSGYTRLIERLLGEKARIGGIGLQFHLFSDAALAKALQGEIFRPGQLLEALDHYGQFHLPIHISEITLTAPGNTPEGLKAQAEVARNFYRLWFSHSAVGGISWWNLPDGGAAQGESKVYSGLLFEDMTPKPAYETLKHLFHREWHTETSGVTDAEGNFHFRGFHGTYLVETDSGKSDAGIQSGITLQPAKDAHSLIRLH